MCNMISALVTKDAARVVAAPGVYHHSELAAAISVAGSGFRRGDDAVGLEINVRRRAAVLDEGTLPAWYEARHDDAIWEWLVGHVGGKGEYRRWLAGELARCALRSPKDLGYALAPLDLSLRSPTGTTVTTPVRVPDLSPPPYEVDRFLDVVAGMEDRVERWAAPWEDEETWTINFDHDLLSTGRSAEGGNVITGPEVRELLSRVGVPA